MTPSLPEKHPLRQLFSASVEQTFYSNLGICDPPIVDYLTELLSSLIHMDDIFPYCDEKGRRLEDLAEIVTEAVHPESIPPADRRRVLHQHIGDLALFWAGLYPETLRRFKRVGVANRLLVYCEQGKRSYAIASELSEPDCDPSPNVLQRLSDTFEYCVYGLNLCRREWDVLGANIPKA
jgi:hypothetical protein